MSSKRKRQGNDGSNLENGNKSDASFSSKSKSKKVRFKSGEDVDDDAAPKEASEVKWAKEDQAELLERMEKIIPVQDNLRFKSRIEKFDWSEVAFKDYSGHQCLEMWTTIQKNIRGFRILREVIEDAKKWIEEPWNNYRNRKKKQHPDMPRRPLSSFMLFHMKNKDKALKANPGLDVPKLSKCIAEMYKNLSPRKKERYINLALEERKKYDLKMKEFYRNHPSLKPSRHSRHKENAVPKKPFSMFYENQRLKAPEGFDRIACKELWKNLSDKKKLFWINLALEQEEKYITEHPSDIPNSKQNQNLLTKEERTLKERMDGKPNKPPKSAYSLFSRVMLGSDKIKTVNPKERMLLIAQEWKNCSPTEKQEYQEKVLHMMEQYKLEYATYLDSLPEDKRNKELLDSQPKRKVAPKKAKATTSSRPPTVSPKEVEREKSSSEAEENEEGEEDVEDTFFYNQPKILYKDEPEQPPITTFLLFVQKMTKKKNYTKEELTEMWNNMSSAGKIQYRRKLDQLKQEYIKKYEQFLKGLSQEQLREYSIMKSFKKADKKESSDDSNSDDSDDQNQDSNNDQDADSSSSSSSED